MHDDNDRSGLRTGAPLATPVRVAPAAGGSALPQGSYDIRCTSSRRPGASNQVSNPGRMDERRPDVRQQGEIIMKAFERPIETVGYFVVGFASGLALVCAFVIVTTDLGTSPKAVRLADIVHLDSVVVTISADRFAEIRAELDGVPVLVRMPEHGATQG